MNKNKSKIVEPETIRTLTYGEVPVLGTLEARFEEEGIESFSFTLRGSDADTADDLNLDTDGAADVFEFHSMIETLATAWSVEGNERAGDLASSFLQAVGLEWI